MILLWDVDSGLAQIDKYFHSDDKNGIAGALLGAGILTCGVEHECDPVSSTSRFLQKRPMIVLCYLKSQFSFFRHSDFLLIM